jgi:hypothetical protein
MEPEGSYRVHISPPPVPILSQMDPIHPVIPCFFNIHCDRLFPHRRLDLPIGLCVRVSERTSPHLFHACYMRRPSHHPWFHDPYRLHCLDKSHTMNVLILKLSCLVALCARDGTTSSSELHGSPKIARCLQTVRLPCNVSCVLLSLPNTAELAGGCDAAVHVDSATTTRTPPLTTFFTLLHFPLPGGGWLVAWRRAHAIREQRSCPIHTLLSWLISDVTCCHSVALSPHGRFSNRGPSQYLRNAVPGAHVFRFPTFYWLSNRCYQRSMFAADYNTACCFVWTQNFVCAKHMDRFTTFEDKDLTIIFWSNKSLDITVHWGVDARER